MRNFKILLLFLLIVAGLSSCIGSGSEESTSEFRFPDNFEYVEDAKGNPLEGFNGISCHVKLSSNGTADITLNGLKTPDKTAYGTTTISDLRYSFAKEGWIEVVGDNVTGNIAGTDVTLKLSQFSLRIVPAVSSDRNPGFFIKFMLDGRYSVFCAPRVQTLFGTTTSSYSGGTYQTTSTDYVFSFDGVSSTANILMRNCSFVENMRKMDITLEKVPFTVYRNEADFSAVEIIPVAGGTPYPGFAIRDLSGKLAFGGDMSMDFRCNPPTMPFDFNVHADCKFDFVIPE